MRIDLNCLNTSNSCLNNLRIKTVAKKSVLAMEPKCVVMEYIRPREKVCQMIYLG